MPHTIISDEVGINKPQPEIFHIALEHNGLQAEDVIMIGDSYSSDIQGAINAGIDQIWIRPSQLKDENSDSKTATYIVTKLSDVMNIL